MAAATVAQVITPRLFATLLAVAGTTKLRLGFARSDFTEGRDDAARVARGCRGGTCELP